MQLHYPRLVLGEPADHCQEVLGLVYALEYAVVLGGVLLLDLLLDVLVDVDVLAFAADQHVVVDGVVFDAVFEAEEVAALKDELAEQILSDLEACQFAGLLPVEEETVVLAILLINHLP